MMILMLWNDGVIVNTVVIKAIENDEKIERKEKGKWCGKEDKELMKREDKGKEKGRRSTRKGKRRENELQNKNKQQKRVDKRQTQEEW